MPPDKVLGFGRRGFDAPQWLAQPFVLGALALIFSGFERLMASRFTLLHYGLDFLIVCAIGVTVAASGLRRFTRTPGAGIYLAWILLYFAWGIAVAPNRQAVWQPALRGLELNVLILAAVVAAVRDRASLRLLANLIQIVVLLNLVVALVQAAHPEITTLIATRTHATMYALQRPAGLWLNPNEAGIAYLFAIALSNWASRWYKWLGRGASIVGIFLTASRGAMFPLVAYIALMIFVGQRHRLPRIHLRTVAIIAGLALAAVVVGVGGVLLLNPRGSGPITEALRYPFSRFVNFAEATPEGNDAPRLPLAIYWFKRALAGPLQGTGVFSFQGNGTTVVGAHNIFLTVWGETGFLSLILYLAVIGRCLAPSLGRGVAISDRLPLLGMWFLYLAEGFLWHNQFSSVVGILIIGLLVCLPQALTNQTRAAETAWKPRRTFVNKTPFTGRTT